MLTVLLAAALLLAVGMALGRAPVYRALLAVFCVVTLAVLAFASLWLAAGLETALRAGGNRLPDAVALTLIVVLPVAGTFLLVRWLRRRNWPRWFWGLAGRPATLSLPAILLVQAAVLVFVVGGGRLAAAWCEARAEKAWRANGQPLEALPAKFPKTATSPGASDIRRQAEEIGISIGAAERGKPARDASFYPGVKNAISAYAFREARRTQGAPEAAPLEVRAWLAMNHGGLRALAQQVLNGPSITWASDIDDWQSPSHFGLADLHVALLAQAFQSRHDRAPGAGDEYLEAAWRLTASLRELPSSAARLNAVFQDRLLLGALRAGASGEEWAERLRSLDDPQRLLGTQAVVVRSLLLDAKGPRTSIRGLYLEGSHGSALLHERPEAAAGRVFLLASGGGVGMNDLVDAITAERDHASRPWFRWLQGPLERPYLGFCAADYARATAASYARVAAMKDACTSQTSPAASGPGPASWNLLAGSGDLDRLAHTGAALRAEAELTRLVLGARTARAAAPDRAWPRQLDGLESTACPGRRFVYEVSADGQASVRLEPNPFEEREATVTYRLGLP